MSYNIRGGGANGGKGIQETVAVLRAAEADLVGLQEVRTEGEPCTPESCPPLDPSVGPALAEALGFHHHEQAAENPALWSNAMLSRFPIAGVAPHELGVSVELPDGRVAWLLNVHHDDAPYQPYQLLGSSTVRPRSSPPRPRRSAGPPRRGGLPWTCSTRRWPRPRARRP